MGRRLAAIAVAIAVLTTAAGAGAGWTYNRAIGKASKSGKIYDPGTWEARLIWYATFFDDDFRDAFDKRHLQITHISGDNATNFLEEQQRIQQTTWTFFVTMYTKEPYKKFTAFEDSFWKISLTTGTGETVAPISVDNFPVDPYAITMFHFVDRWSKLYRVVFPKVPLGDRISLTIESVVGESTVSWKIKDK
jgi:hypothetical protein